MYILRNNHHNKAIKRHLSPYMLQFFLVMRTSKLTLKFLSGECLTHAVLASARWRDCHSVCICLPVEPPPFPSPPARSSQALRLSAVVSAAGLLQLLASHRAACMCPCRPPRAPHPLLPLGPRIPASPYSALSTSPCFLFPPYFHS